ncbi:hypothetical protein [Pontibacter mangrovi]|uniref:Uncharacterized protein n=1 Tax=Pontibacter mangrovi TaxID=2589816 RepID=A0A501W6N6_9BACT|nr:hypothetical protein [Pontibacter mangrovi]TPE43960.1 hypothetical protein FJM65_11080 [Pontibacter mangrovi]
MQNLIEMEVEGKPVVLNPGTSLSFEWNNPLFAQEVIPGSFSLPFTIPAAPNGQVFGFPEIVANTKDSRREWPCTVYCEGEQINGILKLRKVTEQTYTANVQIGFSAFGELIKNKSIRDFGYGGERVMGEDLTQVLNHMQDTAKRPADFDYVFAPVHNPSLYGDKNTQYRGYVNYYNMQDYQAVAPGGSTLEWYDSEGNPVYHYFAYNLGFSVMGSSGSTANAISPFPKLKYVLEQVVAELGVQFQEDFFDEELSQLYILSNTVLDRLTTAGGLEGFTVNNSYRYSFHMKDQLPNLTFSQLLQALKDTFGLSVQVGLDKTVSIRKLRDLLEQNDYQDLTPYVSPGVEMPIEERQGLTLRYKLDDDVSSERVQDLPEGHRLLDPVETPADLQALNYTGPTPEHNDVRYVRSEKAYYRYSLMEEPIGWGFLTEDYMPLLVNGGGDDLEQGIALTLDSNQVLVYDTNNPASNETMKMPSFGVEGYSAPFGVFNVPQSLRLAFYRGYQPIKEQKENRLYPLLSGDNYNARGEQIGQYSLKLDGEHGTYATFLQSWMELQANPKPVIRQLYLNMPALKKIDFNRKVNIDGNRFLIKKLKFSLPLRKAVTAELIQVKK